LLDSLAGFVLFLTLTFARPLPAQPKPGSGDFKISMDVEQVVLSVSVHKRDGDSVPDLEEQDFQIYEDGKLQQINFFSREDIPVTVGLVIDRSRSMRQKWNDVIAAATAFASTSNPQDDMFLVSFNEKPLLGLADEEFIAKPFDLKLALLRHPPDGQTALYDATDLGMKQLAKGRWDKQALVILSDGGDNASQTTFRQILDTVGRSHVIVYAVGIYDPRNNDDPDPGVLKKLTRISGGAAFFPNAVERVVEICEQIAHDIRNQYMIGYTPANQKRDGSFRNIRVQAKDPRGHGLQVRTRAGYFAPAGDPPLDKVQASPAL
jgi:VWFA-related protein